MYLLSGSFVVSAPKALVAKLLTNPVNIHMWHKCFAHFGESRVKKAMKLVDGLAILEDECITGNYKCGKCRDCVVGNSKCRHGILHEKPSKPGETVHIISTYGCQEKSLMEGINMP